MYRTRFAALYAALAAVVAGSGAVAYLGAARFHPPAPTPCSASAPDIGSALYTAAYCRVGKKNVASLGWMPHINPDGFPSRTVDEVAIIDFKGDSSFWLAQIRIGPSSSRVERLTRCGANC
jgi:hypothetical protein